MTPKCACLPTASASTLGSKAGSQAGLCISYVHSDGSSADEDTERLAANAEEELEQLQALNLGGVDSRDGVLDEVRTQTLLDPVTLCQSTLHEPVLYAPAAGLQPHCALVECKSKQPSTSRDIWVFCSEAALASELQAG